MSASKWDFKNHFNKYWNVNDAIYLTFNIIILLTNLTYSMTLDHQRVIAAFASIFMWLKVLDWLRLFDDTAFFISLIKETMNGIVSFLIIMVVWYMTFGTAFYMINLSRKQGSDGDFISGNYGVWILDAFESQYELGVGEYALDAY